MQKVPLSSSKSDTVTVESVTCIGKERTLLEAFGICKGVNLKVFYRGRNSMIVLIEKTKLALSSQITDAILILEK